MEASDGGEGKGGSKRRRPTAEEVVERLRDDGDFDSLRLSLIRKIKHNEELRKSIVEDVKQSAVLNADGSEQLKLRDLSDSIYQELGTKIMGQISDEVWKLINSSEEEIKSTVESVYNRLINPQKEKEKEKEIKISTSVPGKSQNHKVDQETEPDEPPGFALKTNGKNNVEGLKVKLGLEKEIAPPGFEPRKNGADVASEPCEEELDAPPGFC
ncbi:hypothetical protein LUZ60_006064 [Juncus effusus]|nr:hypothetical protein LUZ60_006064 [Juncus effusus]